MKKSIFFLIPALVLNLSSCTIPGNHYLVNKTGEELTVEMKFTDSSKGYIQELQIRTMVNSEKKIRFRTFKKMKVIEVDFDATSNSIQFVLGKNEFAFIGSGRNYHSYHGLKSFSAKGETALIEINDSQSNKNKKVKINMSGLLKYVSTTILGNN